MKFQKVLLLAKSSKIGKLFRNYYACRVLSALGHPEESLVLWLVSQSLLTLLFSVIGPVHLLYPYVELLLFKPPLMSFIRVWNKEMKNLQSQNEVHSLIWIEIEKSSEKLYIRVGLRKTTSALR